MVSNFLSQRITINSLLPWYVFTTIAQLVSKVGGKILNAVQMFGRMLRKVYVVKSPLDVFVVCFVTPFVVWPVGVNKLFPS